MMKIENTYFPNLKLLKNERIALPNVFVVSGIDGSNEYSVTRPQRGWEQLSFIKNLQNMFFVQL